MNVLYDKDIDGSVLDGKTIAVIGYGSQGRAHACNLRDSGCPVIVGLRGDSASREKARDDGHDVRTAGEAARAAEVVMMLVPDELAPRVYADEVEPNMRPVASLAFAHGFGVHFGKIVPGPGASVFMVAPKGPGHLVRSEFARGRGVPCLVAVHGDDARRSTESSVLSPEQAPHGSTLSTQHSALRTRDSARGDDAAGDVRALALAYASAIGGGRAGILETTFREETETDLFGEQAVLCGGLTSLIEAGFETLVDAGYAPEMAYFECLHEMKLIVDLLYEGGLSRMRHSISNTAEYGDLTRGGRIVNAATRAEMRRLLADIQSGVFADEWMGECAAGKPNFMRLESEARRHPIEVVGARLRSMMPWLQETRGESAPRPGTAALQVSDRRTTEVADVV